MADLIPAAPEMGINGLWGGSELGPFISCQLNRSTQHMH